jgi:acetyl esterase
MPLDPEIRQMLETTGGSLPDVTTQPLDVVRRVYDMSAGISTIELAEIRDMTIPGPAGDLAVRLYRPEGEGAKPGLVYFHGGGWVIGSLVSHDPACRRLAQMSGCVIIAVDYRLAPEHRFPAAFDDAYAAASWVAAEATSLGIDPTRIGVAGDSAGANLAAAVTLKARDEAGPALSVQILIYPATQFDTETPSDIRNAEGYGLTTAAMRWFCTQYIPDPAHRQSPFASLMNAQSVSGLPPAFVATAEFDPLCDEGEAYAERLRAAGVPVTTIRYNGTIHGFLRFNAEFRQTKALWRDLGVFLREWSASP